MKPTPRPVVVAPPGLIRDLQRRVSRGCAMAGTICDDAYRAAYIGELATLHAQLVDADPVGDAHYQTILAHHTELMERGRLLRDLLVGVVGATRLDAQIRTAAKRMERRITNVSDYLTELRRQNSAQAWRH